MHVHEKKRAHDANLEEGVLSAIRALNRAVDSHSRRLRDQVGLTLPQVVVLKKLSESADVLSAGALAREAGLGQPTIKVILDSLQRRGFVTRTRDLHDRRTTRVRITEEGRVLAARAPSLLSDAFWLSVATLEDWERTQLLSSIQRLARMMRSSEEGETAVA